MLTFDELYQLAERAKQTRALAVDLLEVAPAAADTIAQYIDTARLDLRRVSVALLAPQEIRLSGTLQLGLKIDCEMRVFKETSGLGYALTFGTSNPLDLLPSDFRVVTDIVDIEALLWTASSRAIDQVDIAISGLQAKALRMREGLDNFHLKLDNTVLEKLGLAESVFELALAGQVPQFSVAKRLTFRLPPALDAEFNRLTVGAGGLVELDGRVLIKLLGVSIPPIPTNMRFDPISVAVRVPVPDMPQLPQAIPLQKITLHQSFAELKGQLGAPSYAIAADGRFKLPGGSDRGGTYRFEYSAGNPGPIPDVLELSVNELTLSDALNLVSPAPMRLPDGIDNLVSLRNGYAHYAVTQGARSSSGARLDKGASVRGSITLFGAPAYLAVNVTNAGMQARLLTNPLRLGSVIALRGTGVNPPANYSGPSFDNDAIGIAIDTAHATAKAALVVDFLGTTVSRLEGAIERSGITIKTATSLPNIAQIPLEVHAGTNGLSAKGSFEFRQPVDLPFKAGFNLQGLGRFSGTFSIEGVPGQPPRIKAQARLDVLGFSVSVPIDLDPEQLTNLAEVVVQALYDEVRRVLLDAVELVKAFLMGAVHYTLAAAEAGRKLVNYLVVEAGATAQKVMAIMHKAGATAMQALELVRDGAAALGEFAFETVVGVMRTLYSAVEALETLRDWAVQFAGDAADKIAENLAWLMRKGGYAAEAIATEAWRYVGQLQDSARHFSRVLMLGGLAGSEIAKYLKIRGVSADDAGKVLGNIFGTDIIENLLKPAFGLPEAQRVAGNVQRELGRFGRNVEDEWNNFWGRLGIRW